MKPSVSSLGSNQVTSSAPRHRGTVYFIQMELPEGDGGPIKIGYTDGEAAFRLAGLRTGNPYPLTILAEIPGGYDLEKEYHDRFSSARMSGEWFAPAPELLDEIQRLGGTSREQLAKDAARRAAEIEAEACRDLCRCYLECLLSLAQQEAGLRYLREKIADTRAEMATKGIRVDVLDPAGLPHRYQSEFEPVRAQMVEDAITDVSRSTDL